MANRAYLYFTDDTSALTFKHHYEKSDGSEREYMDSRHQLPLAWLLFFGPENVQLVTDPKTQWGELYLVCDWDAAKADFLRRVPLLLSWFPNEFSPSDVKKFLGRVESLIAIPSETFLVLDPSELEIDEYSASAIREALTALDEPDLDAQARFERLDSWSYSREPGDVQSQRDKVFGIFYGPAMPGYFRPRQPWPNEAL